MDVLQLFKRDHARMADLFEKLSETSEGAIKTRERLVEQVTTEIEAHNTVVKERLYPLLGKHKETRDLKPSVRELNQLQRQLSQFQELAVEDPEFLHKARDLKKAVEQHLREEERHIVPALKKALEPEEFDTLAKELADGKREEMQEARQRSEAEREQESPTKQEPPTKLRAVGAENANTAARILHEVGDASRSSARAALESQSRLSAEAGAAGRATIDQASGLALGQMRDAAAFSHDAIVGVQEMQGALVDAFQGTLRANLEVAQGFLRCRSMDELSALQRRFLEQTTQLYMDVGNRVFRAAQKAATGALMPPRAGHH